MAVVDIVFRIAGAQDVRGKIIVLTMEMKMAGLSTFKFDQKLENFSYKPRN